MTVLVTGGAGYIGSHMVLSLLDAGEKVVVIDNLSSGFRWAVAPDASFVQGDISDTELVDWVIASYQVDAVIHFAARVVVPESVENPLFYYMENTVKTRTLLERIVMAGVPHLIFSSTAAVYGMVNMEPVAEDAQLAPISPYGRSKLMSEWMLQDTSRASTLRHVVLRYFNVAGSDPAGRAGQSTANATHLIKVACELATGQRTSLQVYGTDYPTPDGTCIRDYIHVSDLVNAHLCALRHLRAGGENDLFNCGYGRGYSVLEVLNTVENISGQAFQVEYAPRRPGDPASIIAKADRIRAILGWSPRYEDLRTIVSHALAWEHRLLSDRK